MSDQFNKRVLITGASGFIGFHLVEAALASGLEVSAAIRKSSAIEHLKGLPVTFVDLQYADENTLEQQLANYHYVIHAGGATKALTQAAYDTVNVDITDKICKALLHSNLLEKLVFVSSLAVIGPVAAGEVITEDTTPNPVTAYGKSKLKAERLLQRYDLPWVGIRPTAVYGPREKDILTLIKSIVKGWDVYISTIDQQLSFVYVTDLATAIMNSLTGKERHNFFNITDGKAYDRYQLADIIKAYKGKTAKRIHLPYGLVKLVAYLLEQLGKISGKAPILNVEKLNELTAVNWTCSIDKAQQLLQYQPEYDLKKGLEETIDWYEKHQWI